MSREKANHDFLIRSSPLFWAHKAHSLLHAAELLWPEIEAQLSQPIEEVGTQTRQHTYGSVERTFFLHPHTFPIYMALMGFSIECLLKGIIILKKPYLVNNGSIDKSLKTHDLRALAGTAGVELTRNQRIFLDQATSYIKTEFRYPVAQSVKDEGQAIQLGGHAREESLEMFHLLYPIVEHELHPRLKRSPKKR